MSRPKAQHYVTGSYLRLFATGAGKSARLQVYERGQQKTWGQHPDKVARRTNYYSIQRKDGTFDDAVEELLELVESSALPVLLRLANEEFEPTLDERVAIGMFIAFQELRVPGMREMFENSEVEMMKRLLKVGAEVPKYFEQTMEKIGHPTESADDLRRWVQEGFKESKSKAMAVRVFEL
jgi:hypothetical protein